MNFQTFAEVIDGVIAYHRQASSFYSELSARIETDLKELLVEDLARQHKKQADALHDYRNNEKQNILQTQFQFASVDDLWEAPECDARNGEPSLQTIQNVMRHIDNGVAALYQQLAAEQLPPELTEILNRMAEQQSTIAKKHTFTAQQLESI